MTQSEFEALRSELRGLRSDIEGRLASLQAGTVMKTLGYLPSETPSYVG
jgi:hypothetical protein